jgi:hypothetical protein
MRRVLIIIVVGFLGWQVYQHHQAGSRRIARSEELPKAGVVSTVSPNVAQFKCDGRTYCSQMTSCEEATYFLRNCPGVKMDGNNDGVPCEQQWCRR